MLYFMTAREVFRAPLRPDGGIGEVETLMDDLPDAGQHLNRTLAVGPDNMLYISAGSICNACDESSQENATLIRARLDGKSRRVWASGLRNTIGFVWHPRTGDAWGWDQGIDWLGNDLQREEVNRLEARSLPRTSVGNNGAIRSQCASENQKKPPSHRLLIKGDSHIRWRLEILLLDPDPWK